MINDISGLCAACAAVLAGDGFNAVCNMLVVGRSFNLIVVTWQEQGEESVGRQDYQSICSGACKCVFVIDPNTHDQQEQGKIA